MIALKDMFRTVMMLTILFPGTGMSSAALPHALESAQYLPDSCMAMVAVDSVQELTRQFQKTPLYAWYRDPVMKPAIGAVETKIRENLKTKIASFWQDIKINHPPQTLPWPQGRLVIGVEVSERAFPVEGPDDENTPSENTSEKDLDWQFVGIAEMGSHTEAIANLLPQIMLHRSRRVGPTELHWIVPDGDADPDYDTFCYALEGHHLVVSTSARLAAETLKNIQHPGGPSLGRSPVLTSLVRDVQDGLITFYLEAEPLRKPLVNLLPDMQKPQVQKALQELGIESIQGLISSIRFNGQPQEVMRCQTLLATKGPVQGILSVLCPESAELKLNSSLLGSDCAMFTQSHLNLSQAYDRIVAMVRQIKGIDLNFFVQTALAATGGQQAPVDLKRDLLDQMAAPLTSATTFKRPFTTTDQARDLWSIPLRNSDVVDTALARIHQTFLARHDPELQRKMLDHTLYLLPEIKLETRSQADNLKTQDVMAHMAFTVVNGELVFGQLDDLEQLVRNTRREHIDTLASDPMFRTVRRYFPSQAAYYSYANLRTGGEFAWEWLRQSLKQSRDRQDLSTPDESEPLSQRRRSVRDDFLRELSDLVQAEQLPPFSAIQKYLGASISYGKRTDRGLFGETLILRAPSPLN